MEAELQNAVYFLCGSGTTELPSIIPCAEAELQTLKSHSILCAEAELRNLKSQYIPNAEVELRHNLRQRIFCVQKQNLKSQHIPYVEAELWNYKSQNILCTEAELQVTEYSRCGISLVSYAMVRKTWERRAAGPCVKAILVVLLAVALRFFLFSPLLSSSNNHIQ